MLDLTDEEVSRFLAQIREATEETSLGRAAYSIDSIVVEWREVARKHREYAEEKARRKLQEAIDEEYRKRAGAEEALARAQRKIDELVERDQEREENLNMLRELLRHRRDKFLKVDPHDVAMIIGWHTR
jgi:hypothetical protein